MMVSFLIFLPFYRRIHDIADGLLYYDGDSDEASLNPALNAAMLLLRFAPLASTPEKKNRYQVRMFDHCSLFRTQPVSGIR
jgi:hypothetical protein